MPQREMALGISGVFDSPAAWWVCYWRGGQSGEASPGTRRANSGEPHPALHSLGCGSGGDAELERLTLPGCGWCSGHPLSSFSSLEYPKKSEAPLAQASSEGLPEIPHSTSPRCSPQICLEPLSSWKFPSLDHHSDLSPPTHQT